MKDAPHYKGAHGISVAESHHYLIVFFRDGDHAPIRGDLVACAGIICQHAQPRGFHIATLPKELYLDATLFFRVSIGEDCSNLSLGDWKNDARLRQNFQFSRNGLEVVAVLVVSGEVVLDI